MLKGGGIRGRRPGQVRVDPKERCVYPTLFLKLPSLTCWNNWTNSGLRYTSGKVCASFSYRLFVWRAAKFSVKGSVQTSKYRFVDTFIGWWSRWRVSGSSRKTALSDELYAQWEGWSRLCLYRTAHTWLCESVWVLCKQLILGRRRHLDTQWHLMLGFTAEMSKLRSGFRLCKLLKKLGWVTETYSVFPFLIEQPP